MFRLHTEAKRFGRHGNAFGFLRLIFAALVIVSHTPEMADGSRSRELLTRLFGTLSFGELAVDGFFIVSGYLIAASFMKNSDVGAYLLRRIARIYPAFIVSSLVAMLIIAPLAGGVEPDAVVPTLKRLAFLISPHAPGVFEGTSYAHLNSATWTIAYEFRCYLLILGLGVAGLLHRPWLIAALAVGFQAAHQLVDPAVFARIEQHLPYAQWWLGSLSAMLRLASIFLAGTLFYLLRSKVRFTAGGVAFAVVACGICLMVPALAEPGLGVFGGYLIFAAATVGGRTWIARINDRNDISYGTYLYAWPIEKLLFWYFPAAPLLAVGAATLGGALLLGAASWFGVEKPVMEWIRLRRTVRSESVEPEVTPSAPGRALP